MKAQQIMIYAILDITRYNLIYVSLFDKRVNAYSGFLLIFHNNLALIDGKTRPFYLIKQTSAD